ncbi:TVP38/TMEM64 family protein [Paenibacillus sp. Leaf72]|uniref:TVP38/TMEM64 family protein n=1 Tax=Paenibacillus sp. Leaf72 TaxID=1736234 RepID=UPI0006FB8571|nr:VTT domain-containing protein [Paenibacillus sp. Leaf72]KQO18216.1 hypothetical protein ASF12_06170 [Paenibacillus sp. Leaf72]
MLKWVSAIIYALLLATVFIYKNNLLDWLQNDTPSVFIVFLVALFLVLVPVVPFKIMIALLGFMYGPLLGALISWLAASLAAIIIFLLARYLFREQGQAFLHKFSQLDKLQATMEKRPFLTILTARLIPIIPHMVVNIYPAVTSVRLLPYAVASALGKIPFMLLFAYMGQNMFKDWASFTLFAGVYAAFFALSYGGYRLWLKRQ